MALRFMTEDKMYWDPQETEAGNLKERLKVFERAMDRGLQRSGSADEEYLPKGAAGRLLFRHFVAGDRDVDITVYNRFMELIKIWATDPAARKLLRARLELVHPNVPNPQPALDFLKLCNSPDHGSDFINGLMKPIDSRTASMLFWVIVDTARQLLGQRRTVDAHWTLDFGRFIMPLYFTMVHNNPYKGQANFLPIRGRAGPHASKTAANLDERGSLKDTERSRSTREAMYKYDSALFKI
ncbi:hypothetical protein LTR85_007834 [Meristemomyces frigidus]|nr:hypothetical protein LTR85_007834 [Meristemomyces frigidus]